MTAGQRRGLRQSREHQTFRGLLLRWTSLFGRMLTTCCPDALVEPGRGIKLIVQIKHAAGCAPSLLTGYRMAWL